MLFQAVMQFYQNCIMALALVGLDQHQDTGRERVHKQCPLIREINCVCVCVCGGGGIKAVNVNRPPESRGFPTTVPLSSLSVLSLQVA